MKHYIGSTEVDRIYCGNDLFYQKDTGGGELEPIRNGLVCWLDGRDGSGTDTTWVDRSGNGNDATIYGGNFNDSSLRIVGYATLNNATKNLKEYTLEFFYKTNNTITWNAIFTNRSLGSNGYSLNLNGHNVISFYNGTEYKNISLGFTGILLERVCFTVVCVSDGSNTKFTFYKNGVKGYERTLPLTISDSDIMAINTRSQNDGAPVFPRDNRDNNWYSFKSYNRALTEAEIQQNYEYEQSIIRG